MVGAWENLASAASPVERLHLVGLTCLFVSACTPAEKSRRASWPQLSVPQQARCEAAPKHELSATHEKGPPEEELPAWPVGVQRRGRCAPHVRDHEAWSEVTDGDCSVMGGWHEAEKIHTRSEVRRRTLRRLVAIENEAFWLYAEVRDTFHRCDLVRRGCTTTPAPIVEIVNGLGRTGSAVGLMYVLANTDARGAVAAAIHGLHAHTSDVPELWHMCARVRFLEQMTGTSFEVVADESTEDFDAGFRVPFCGFHMSSASILLPSREAQQRIVAMWQAWWSKKRDSAKLSLVEEPAFFFGP